MAPQQASGTNGGEGNGNAARRRTRPARRRTQATRAGAATGTANPGSGGHNLQGLTPEQRKFYNLGAKHTCEMHGINWSGGTIAGR